MTILQKCPYCDTRYSGREEVCSDCQKHFEGIFFCRAEKLTQDQKIALGRFFIHLKKKDEERKQ